MATSLLEAVNAVLATIGELPVSSILTSGFSEAVLARDTILEVSREVQSIGLHCNTDYKYTLTPDINGLIVLPPGVLKVDASYRYQDVTQREGRLYDRDNHTFVFGKPIDVDIVWELDFEDLPETVKRYIIIRAARLFQKRVVGSDALHVLSEDDERRAFAAVMAEEVLNEDANILEGPLAYQGTIRRGSVLGVT